MLEPLANPVYRRLFAAQVIALAGTGLTTVALALIAYDLAGPNAGAVLGTALAIKMVAYVAIAPIAGGFAGSLPRKWLLIGLDLARAALVACLPFVTEIWQIYVLIFLMQACSAGFTPTFQATIPDVVRDERTYIKALSLSRLAYDLESLVSPALAGLALLFLSFNDLFIVNAIAFLVSAALVLSASLPWSQSVSGGAGTLDRITFGLRAYLATPRLQGLLAISFAVAAAGAMVLVNTVVYVQGTLGLGARETAAALAMFGAGSMTAAFLVPKLLDRFEPRPVMIGGAALTLPGLLAGALAPGFTSLLTCWFVIGLGYGVAQTPGGQLLRRSAQEADRPAYFSAQFALSHACWLLTYPLAGWLGAKSGLSVTFVMLALLVVLGVAVALRVWPADDPDELEHSHEPTEHEHRHVHDEHHVHDHVGEPGAASHAHRHQHAAITHTHPFRIDPHHRRWPKLRRHTASHHRHAE